jgi:hypothetical protein
LYNHIGGGAAATAVALPVTGELFHGVYIGIALIVLAGMVFTILSIMEHRFAIEPIRGKDGKRRLRFTRNGKVRKRK